MSSQQLGGVILIGVVIFASLNNKDSDVKDDKEDNSPSVSISEFMVPMYSKDQRDRASIYREMAEKIREGESDSQISDYWKEASSRRKTETFDPLFSLVASSLAKSITDERALALESLANKVEGVDDE